MELLIVLGLCFGAYELLGVFQGCFQYNEHPLPYQPHHHFNSGDTKDDNEEQLSETRKEHPCDNETECSEANEKADEGSLESIKSGPCSCYSTADDVFDDDLRTILSTKRPIERKRFVFDKPISKFTVSTSLMSLNRDESSLYNYIDDINNNRTNNKFYKFRSEQEGIAETAFDQISSSKVINDSGKTNRRNSSDIALYRKHNEHSESSSSVNVDINNKKIFFISAAT
jgi:hypothetical protein